MSRTERTSGVEDPARPIGRRGALLLLCALLPFVGLSLALWPWGPSLYTSDWAQYLLHAQALVEGRPYADTGYIFWDLHRFLAPPAYPPGLPLSLAPLAALFGGNLVPARLFMLAMGTAFVALGGYYFARHDDPLLGAGVALMSGLSLEMLLASTQPLTDLPFAALVWGVIVLADEPGEWGRRRLVGVTVLAVAATLYRTVGFVLAPALLLYALFNRRRAGWKPLVPPLVLGGILLASVLIIPHGVRRGIPTLDYLVNNLLEARIPYDEIVFESHLHPFPWDAANDAYHLLSVPLMLVGVLPFLWEARRRFVVHLTVAYGLFLLILPFEIARIAWPLFPVSVYGLLRGVRRVGRLRLAPARASAVALGFAAVVAVGAGARALTAAHPPARYTSAEFRELVGWFREPAVADSARAALFRPRVLTWETGVPAMGLARLPPERWIEELCRLDITHAVTGDLGLQPDRDASLRSALERYPERVRVAYRNEEFTVYRLDRSYCGDSPGSTPVSPRPPP